MSVTETGFEVLLSARLHAEIASSAVTSTGVLPFKKIVLDEKKNTARYTVPLPYITFPNHTHKTVNWEEMRISSLHLGTLLSILREYVEENDPKFVLHDKPQMVIVECGVTERWAYVGAGFSPKAKKILATIAANQGVMFQKIQERMQNCYARLSSKTKQEFLLNTKKNGTLVAFSGVGIGVRKGGVPQLSAPGNCCCLGASPDEFSERGELYPHNIDSPLQLFTIVTGIVDLWNEELKPRRE
jgi:hypothetical protein